MTPDRLEACLAALGWSLRELAAQLGIGDQGPRSWQSGRKPVPAPIAAWIELLARYHESNPPPRRPTE